MRRVASPIFAVALACALPPSPAAALDLPRVGEVRPGGRGGLDWLDPHGWVRLRSDWDRTPQGTLRGVTFLVVDVRQARAQRLTFPVEPLRARHPDLFIGPPNVDLVHFDGTRALLRFDRREPLRTVSRYAVWTPASGALGEPTTLGGTVLVQEGKRRGVERATWLAGADPAAGRLYYAETSYDPRATSGAAPLALRLTRVDFPGLQRDGWEAVITPPHRARPLPLETYRAFSPDGRWLALAEYSERGGERPPPGDPPAQVYVVDLGSGAVARYPIPPTPYGLAFSRDGRYLAVGSHQDAEVVRIDLVAGRVDLRAKVQAGLHALVTTPSGDALLVLSDHRGAPRSIEVRRWSDLSLRETVPMTRLFPGLPGLHASTIRATADGRFLAAPRFGRDGFPAGEDAGVVTFAVDEAASAEGRADPVAVVRTHVERTGLKLYPYLLHEVGGPEGAFAPIAAGPGGEAFVLGTAGAGGQPWAIWVDARGKVLWERSLRRGALFQEYEACGAAFTADGDVIAFLLGYVRPGAPATSRLVRLDGKGQVRWEWTGPVGPEARFAEALRLLPDGTVRMTGHVGTTTTPWTGDLDAATGRLLREETGGGR